MGGLVSPHPDRSIQVHPGTTISQLRRVSNGILFQDTTNGDEMKCLRHLKMAEDDSSFSPTLPYLRHIATHMAFKD